MKYKVTLNDRVYEVEVEQGEAMLVDEYALKAPAAAVQPVVNQVVNPVVTAAAPATANTSVAIAQGEAVKSPMPGNILKINVTQGQSVNEGDVLMVLEAMKMENEIISSRSGTVAQILVTKGAVVETGAPLVVIA